MSEVLGLEKEEKGRELKNRNFPEIPTASTFSKVLRCKWEAYLGTNGRCTTVQMQRYIAGLPFLEGLEARKVSDTNGERAVVQIGGACGTF